MRVSYYHSPILYTIFYNLPSCLDLNHQPSHGHQWNISLTRPGTCYCHSSRQTSRKFHLERNPRWVPGHLSSVLRSTWTPLGRSQMYLDVSRGFSEVLWRLSNVRICTSTSHERSQKYLDASQQYLDASRMFADVLQSLTSVLRSTWTPLGCSNMYFDVSWAFSEVLGRLWNVLTRTQTSLKRSQ